MAGVAVIAQTTGAADTLEQERLKLAEGDMVIRVARIRNEGDQPKSYEFAVLPLARFPGLTPESNIEDDIVAFACAHGVTVGRATEALDTTYATTEVAEHLGIDPDEAVLKLDRVVRCAAGLPIEWRVGFVAQ
jgi:DNA-binding GntR family transcriptional regulator